MDRKKREKLEKAGWRVGATEEFLDLSDEEVEFLELKLALSSELRERRNREGLSQTELARKLGSSQSRVAKMEASDPTVSIDLLIRGLLATGATRSEIGKAIVQPPRKRTRSARTRGTAA